MDGIINLLKPLGMTSHDCVDVLRRLLGTRRVGHTGTLDPGAAGVLVPCVGAATQLSRRTLTRRIVPPVRDSRSVHE
jgi:tRNA pseudouridine55 synthase